MTFTQEQKDIMVTFYEKQRTSRIRANPADVIEAMKAAGVPTPKESQIKSWWSTYHRKQKQIAQDLVEEARQLRSQHEGKSRNEMIYRFVLCVLHCLSEHLKVFVGTFG